jgi:hypothetical protein
VQSLTNKLIEPSVFLNTSLLNLFVLCFSVHWLIDKQSSSIDLSILHGNKTIAKVYNTKFLGLTLDNTLSWGTQISIISKLSSASFALRVVKPFLSQDSLIMVHYSHFHSVITYVLIFWENSHYSNIIFRLQKIIIRIVVGIRSRDSCREHFNTLKILPLQSQYVLLLLLFVVDNGDCFKEL